MNESGLIKLLTELTKLTTQGKLDWSRIDPPVHYVSGTHNVYPDYYETRYKNQKLGVGIRRVSEYDGERDKFYWNEQYYFLLMNNFDEVIWNHESCMTALSILFDKVRDKVANVDGLIADLLNDDEDL